MDPACLFESQAFVNANPSEQAKTITYMDCDYYNAAAEGKIEFFKDITHHWSLDLLTPIKNTILHIYITALNSRLESTTLNAASESKTNFVKEILSMCPSLLQQANDNGETPLHIAARYGLDGIVDVLIEYCANTIHQDLENEIGPVKGMLRMTNKLKDTALHEAVNYNRLEVVKLLIREDPEFSYSANNAGETPLYIAANKGFQDVLFEILDKCQSPTYGGPLGRTALHAAVIQDNEGMTIEILRKIEGISRKVDNDNWSPLHLAAYSNGYFRIATLLLDNDRHVAYMQDIEGRTALHIAAQHGHLFTLAAIVSRCPDCCEMIDNRGCNVLDYALEGHDNELEDTIKIFERNSYLRSLLNEKKDKMAFNDQNLSAYDIASTNANLPKEKTQEITDAAGPLKDEDVEHERRITMVQQAAATHLIVSALITTVTFAACITMPGGFTGGEGSPPSSPPGSALLRRNAAFQAFIITDTISMVLSSSAVFIHLLMPFRLTRHYDEKRRLRLFFLAFYFTFGALVAMVLSFIVATYAVLESASDLAIANCIIGLTFFVILFFLLRWL